LWIYESCHAILLFACTIFQWELHKLIYFMLALQLSRKVMKNKNFKECRLDDLLIKIIIIESTIRNTNITQSWGFLLAIKKNELVCIWKLISWKKWNFQKANRIFPHNISYLLWFDVHLNKYIKGRRVFNWNSFQEIRDI